MGAHQILRLNLHLFHVQRIDHMGVGVAGQRARMGCCMKEIAVTLALCGKARMKLRGDLLGARDPDVRRQHGVQREAELVRRDAGFGVKVRRLPQRVHARIGAARSGDAELFAGEPENRPFQLLLHGHGVGLTLPACVGGSVVLDDQVNSSHGTSQSEGRVAVEQDHQREHQRNDK